MTKESCCWLEYREEKYFIQVFSVLSFDIVKNSERMIQEEL
jgi:hypothetical protein